MSTVDALAPTADRSSLQGTGDGGAEYNRIIDVASPELLLMYATRYKVRTPRDGFTHDGVSDGGETASVIWYWSGSSWMRFVGAD